MAAGIPARLTAGEGRKFGLTLGLAFVGLGALLSWRGAKTVGLVAAAAGGLLLLAGLAIPGSLGPVYRGWMGFAAAISRVTNPIVMGAIYLLVITPIGLIVRVVKGSPLVRANQASGWVWRAPGARRGNLRHQF
jgi:hypothetical protein